MAELIQRLNKAKQSLRCQVHNLRYVGACPDCRRESEAKAAKLEAKRRKGLKG